MLLPYGEGGTAVANHGLLFDRSDAMTRAFRKWLATRYADDKALQQAWQDEAVTLATAAVPTEEQWHAKRLGQNIQHWPEPTEVRRELDYFLLQKELFHNWWREVTVATHAATATRPCIIGMDNYKQPQHGWLHNPGFFGAWDENVLDRHGSWLAATGCIGVGPLLDMPGLDTVWTPGMYYNRNMGFAWEAEGLTDTMTLRGKVNYVEGDFRTWVNRGLDGRTYKAKQVFDAGVALTPAEAEATFRRALGWAFSRNQMFWFCSVYGGNWWYHDEQLQPLVEETHALVKASLSLPWSAQRDAVCLVIDDESSLFEDFSGGFQFVAVQRQLEEGLARCGVPYRIHLLSDLEHPNMPDYRCWLFPNLFKVDDDVLAVLQKKVLKNGNVAVFGPGTGISDGTQRTAAPASRLFGVEMELVDQRTTRRLLVAGKLARQLPSIIVSDSYSYGPLLVPATQRLPEQAGLRPLGNAFYYHNLDRPGAFVRETGKGAAGNGTGGERGDGDAAIVFMPSAPIPADLVRELARFGGAHIYNEQNAVIHASPQFLSIHVPAAGEWEISLPAALTVTDMASGNAVTTDGTTFTVVTREAETRLYRLAPR
jgi:hypothetical protein